PFVLHCTLDKSAPLGPLTNTATAQAPGGQPVSKSVTIQISNAQPLLTLSKIVDRASAKIGDTVTYTLTATPTKAQPGRIALTDPIDSALKVVGVTVNGAQATCGAMPSAIGIFE